LLLDGWWPCFASYGLIAVLNWLMAVLNWLMAMHCIVMADGREL
jgi:hypothetical protein